MCQDWDKLDERQSRAVNGRRRRQRQRRRAICERTKTLEERRLTRLGKGVLHWKVGEEKKKIKK